MRDQPSYRQLLYQYEVLRARLEIREHYLKTVVREVYENIGQVLSLIRVQLSLVKLDFDAAKKDKIDSSGELVGKTIQDLRSMCQLFYPEEDIISSAGFNKAIEHEIKTLYPAATFSGGEEIAFSARLQHERALLLFGILLEIFTLIQAMPNGQLCSVLIEYTKQKINITIEYKGEALNKNKNNKALNPADLSVFERAELMGGNLQIKNAGDERRRIKLVTPIN
jgi:two-component system NarL family sensor kinase